MRQIWELENGLSNVFKIYNFYCEVLCIYEKFEDVKMHTPHAYNMRTYNMSIWDI